MAFQIYLKKSATKAFDRVSANMKKRISDSLRRLSKSQNPEYLGVQMIGVKPKHFRIRVGAYRVIYRVDSRTNKIMIVKIGHRKNVYK